MQGHRRGSYHTNKYKRPKEYTKYFLAILANEELRSLTRDMHRHLLREARNLRFVDLEKLHMTLQFLGSTVSASSAAGIIERVTQLDKQIPSPEVKIVKANFGFPRQNIARLLHWDAEPNLALQNFTKAIHKSIKDLALEDVRTEKDYQKIIYHFTVARAKHKVSRSFGRQINELISKFEFEPLSFYPKQFYFIKSTIKLNGLSTYEILATFDFA